MKNAVINRKEDRGIINSGLFTLMMFAVSIVMVFAALTSAYIVRRAEGNWLEFDMPSLFVISTIVILLSSATMHLAYWLLKKDNKLSFFATLVTLLLGFGFLVAQWYAWGELVDMSVFFGGSQANAAGSFMYVLTGVHGAHIISAIVYLAIMLYKLVANKITSSNSVVFKTCGIYWHFLGVIWIFLYIFLIINH